MLDLELFSDPVLELDNENKIIQSNSFFDQFYDIRKRKVYHKSLSDLFEINDDFYINKVPYHMLVPLKLGILFGKRLSQNVQLFKTKHPVYDGYTLLHFKDVDAEVRLHNKNLNMLKGKKSDLTFSNDEVLAEVLDHEHCAIFKLKNNKVECLHAHILPQLTDLTADGFTQYLNHNFKPTADWANFFKVISLNKVDLNDIKDLIPEKIKFNNRLLKLDLLPIFSDQSVVLVFKDISEDTTEHDIRENEKVLSHFYSLSIKKPHLLSLFVEEINNLLCDNSPQDLEHILHSLKGLLYFIGLKKFAEDIHIIEFLTAKSLKKERFNALRGHIKNFLDQNTSKSNNINVDKELLDAYQIPYADYISVTSMISNIDELSRFYLEFINHDYLDFTSEKKDFFVKRSTASSLLIVFNHLLRNVGAHGDENTFKLEFSTKDNKLIIRTQNLIKDKSLTKIAFLSGSNIGVEIMQTVADSNEIIFSYQKNDNTYFNYLELRIFEKDSL